MTYPIELDNRNTRTVNAYLGRRNSDALPFKFSMRHE